MVCFEFLLDDLGELNQVGSTSFFRKEVAGEWGEEGRRRWDERWRESCLLRKVRMKYSIGTMED